MSSSYRLNVLEKLIRRRANKKMICDYDKKPFSRNPLHNLLELLMALLSIFDVGRRDKLRIFSSMHFYYIFLTPFTRMFFNTLNRFEFGLVAIFIRFDIGYIKFSNDHFSNHLNLLLSEWMQKSNKRTKNDWLFLARITFQLDQEGILTINALKNIYDSNLESEISVEIWKAATICAGIFHMNGFFKTAEDIEKEGKKLSDAASSRLPGHYLENVYFSAVGHISLLDYLLKGRKSGKFEMCHEQLIYNEANIANRPLARLFLPVCEELGIEILKNHPVDVAEGDLETYVLPDGNYTTARRMYSDIQMYWESEKKDPLLSLTGDMGALGEEILKSSGLPENAWFVGLHIRSTKDPLRVGRNADFENYLEAIAEVSQFGGWVLRTGTDHPINKFNLPNFIDTRLLDLSKFEREILHTYIWARSRFFIGNLSGGTNPPGAFGTPILWTDIHPISGFRPPSRRDLIIPKRIYNSRTSIMLSLKDLLSDEHRISQSENPFKMLMHGYELSSSSSSDLRFAVRDMVTKVTSGKTWNEEFDDINLNSRSTLVDAIFSKVELHYGAGICESFLDRNPSYLA